jgi:hypothetical protein
MQHIKRIGVIAAGVALLVSGSVSGRHDYHPFGEELVATSANPGSSIIYRAAANGRQGVGAIGISGDGIDQDDLVTRGRSVRINGDGSDHSWSVASITSQPGGDLFGVQFS